DPQQNQARRAEDHGGFALDDVAAAVRQLACRQSGLLEIGPRLLDFGGAYPGVALDGPAVGDRIRDCGGALRPPTSSPFNVVAMHCGSHCRCLSANGIDRARCFDTALRMANAVSIIVRSRYAYGL